MKTSLSIPKQMPIGVWIRVSTDDQAKGESPEHHRARAKANAELRGYEIRETYDLAGVSGKSVKDHPEAKRMMRDVERGHIKGLMFSKLARFARNTRELLDFADSFQKHGAALISIEEHFDTSTPVGLLFYTIIAAMAQWEREEIGSRVRESVKIRAKLGKPISYVAPFGYEWKEKKLVQHPERAPVRKLAYELFLKHKRRTTVARLLNQGGYRTKEGKQWYDTTVTRILTDTSAKGVYYINRVKSLGNWKDEPKPESEWGTVFCEPLVTEETWNEVNRILEEQTKNAIRPGPAPKHLFASLLHCQCGRRMYVLSNTPKYFCERCQKRVPCADLEAIFLEKLKENFGDAPRVEGYLREAAKNADAKTDLLATTSAEIAKVKEHMTKTYELFLAGAATPARFKELNDPLEERLHQLQTERVRLQAEVDVSRADALTTAAVVEEALKLQDLWPTLDLERKRNIVQSLVQSIIVDVDAKRITFRFTNLRSSEETTNIQQRL
jgi:site-specific DNA recombinase